VPLAELDGLRELAAQRLQAFAGEAARLGVASVETRLVEDAADYALLMQSRYADLVVLSADADPDTGPGAGPDPGAPAGAGAQPVAPRVRGLPEQLALRGARPVLVVPESYRDQAIPGTVVAGWDGSLQALHALSGALPLLVRAGGVKLALVNPDTMSGLHGEEPGADLALYLARHGVRVEVVVERTRASAGRALTELALDCRAGLVVIGAYGHSRYREWVLGGVTRELLRHPPVPLIMAH
jgi:nucleotide-binding universal stress UspA family protein